uniref:Uncharacterized protein n=1 Tax=Physcomitrium patens TaxID=3218 RepID=A0A2K1IME2_PHYPA|nr:hypothetical protein PHYPA_026752 [Physcomitrium patens]
MSFPDPLFFFCFALFPSSSPSLPSPLPLEKGTLFSCLLPNSVACLLEHGCESMSNLFSFLSFFIYLLRLEFGLLGVYLLCFGTQVLSIMLH